jgi:hypothetical protein
MSSTSRTNRIAAAAVATVATVLATAGGASAETYCVSAPSCPGIAVADVQTALTTAAKTAAPDRIEVGPGTFDTSGGFVYAGAGATNTVELVGAGRDQTELRSASAVNGQPAVLLHASAPSRISDLTITADDPPKPNFGTTGLRILGTAERIKVRGGARTDGVELLKGSTLASSKVSIPDQRFAVITRDPGAVVSNSSIDAPSGYGVEASGPGSLTVSHSNLSTYVGVVAYAGSVKLDNSLVIASNIGLFALDDGKSGGTLDATNVTVAGAGAFVTGAESVGTNQGVATHLTLENSAIAQTAHSLARLDGGGGSASLIVRHSAYDHSTVSDIGSGSIDQAGPNLDLKTLGFVDPAVDDYHLAADSPLRDAGDPAPAGGLATTDLGKNPRSVDGNGDGIAAPDIGAFEFQPSPAPPVTPPVTPTTPPVVTTDIAPVITSAKLSHRRFSIGRAPRRGTAFRLTVSKAATVKIAIAHGKRTAGTLKRASRQGLNRIVFSGRIGRRALRPGRYAARIVAIDASGRRSAPRTLRFTVVKR